jgi:hypothetical protein
MAMRSLPGEHLVHEFKHVGLTLTTHRIRFETEKMGAGETKSIMLESLASCAITRRSHPVLLVFAAVLLLGGVLYQPSNIGIAYWQVGLVGSIFLGILFIVTREQVLELASSGTTIRVQIDQIGYEDLSNFIDTIEASKNLRFLSLRTSSPP